MEASMCIAIIYYILHNEKSCHELCQQIQEWCVTARTARTVIQKGVGHYLVNEVEKCWKNLFGSWKDLFEERMVFSTSTLVKLCVWYIQIAVAKLYLLFRQHEALVAFIFIPQLNEEGDCPISHVGLSCVITVHPEGRRGKG